MKIDIHAGKRVLYKNKGQWEVGELSNENAKVTEKGLYLMVIPKEFIGVEKVPYLLDVEINDMFLEAQPVEDWMKQYGNLTSKRDYMYYIQTEDFDKNVEVAYVSDGEYYYYPVSKYSEAWLEKQPFEYIVRSN